MPIVKQNSWNAGEVNPNLTEASNNPLYFQSALSIDNMYISKTQILKRIPSTRNIEFDSTDATYTNAITAKYNGISYEITWASVAADSKYTVYLFNGMSNQLEKQITFTLTGYNKEFVDFVVFDNKIVFTYLDRAPQVLEFNSTDPTTFKTFSFINQPTLDFGDVDYGDFNFVVPANASSTIVKVSGTNVTTLITTDWIGGMLFGLGDNTSEFLGQGKITAVAINGSGVDITINILHTFQAGTFKGARMVLQKPIFFDVTEYPKVVGYFDSRLYFGNTKSLPMLVTASKVNIANDFNVGKGLPAESIVYILNDTSSSEVRHIVGHIGLFIHTDNNEHVVRPSIQDGITPTAFIAQRLSDWGSNNIKPKIYSNFILFCDKTSRKILKIDSSSDDAFTVNEATIGMEITSNIDNMGVIDDSIVDVKLLAFTYLNNPRINMVTIGGGTFGLTKFDYLPVGNTTLNRILFGQLGEKTIILGKSSTGSQMISAIFTDISTGLTQVSPYSGTSATFTVDTYLYDSNGDKYLFAKANTLTQTPANFNFSGNNNPLFVKSIPLMANSASSWDRKEISYVFISYYLSSRFFVNGSPVAFPSLSEISVTEAPKKSSYDKITTSNKPDKFNYIEIKSSEPYDVRIQAYGWDVKETIIS